MKAIFLKELSSYFKTARGYICLGLYFLFGGMFLLMQIQYEGTNDISSIFSNMYLVVLFTLPILTMRLMSEEKRAKTDQALFTAPVSLWEIVMGKFLAAYTVFAAGMSVTVIYFAVLSTLSSPDPLLFTGNLLGILLLGGALISIGLLISTLTESQMLAAVGTYGCVILIIFLDSISGLLPSSLSFISDILSSLSLEDRFSSFTSGLLNPSNIVFFVSVIAIFLFLCVQALDRNRWVSNRRINNALLSGAVTVVFLIIVVLFNLIFSMVLRRMPSLDLTANHIYQLSEDSIKVLSDLDTDVEILICYDEDTLRDTEYGLQMDELLKDYARRSDRISVRFADLVKEPELSTQYADYNIESGSIIFSSNLRTKASSLNDCVEASLNSTGTGFIYESKAEQVLTSGILYASDQDIMQVSVLTGHQEAGCDDILQYLEENNYEILEQNISTEEIDPDSVMAVLLAPMTDYSAEEMEKLDQYLDNDGNFGRELLYVASYSQPELPGLESFLEEWGIEIGDSLIVETELSNIYDSQGFLFAAEFTDAAEPYLSEVKNPSLPILGYYCRPVTALWDENNNRSASCLVQSTDSCVLYQLQDGQLTGESGTGKENYGIAAIGDRLKYEGSEERRSYVVAFGSTAMFSTSDTVSSNFNNKDFTVALINDLTGKQNGISIESVSFSAQTLTFTQSTYRTLATVLGILLPLACFVLGGVMTVYRRRL